VACHQYRPAGLEVDPSADALVASHQCHPTGANHSISWLYGISPTQG
jgi:hypothetical protein